mmetsp:Transcript_20975/g.54591  ORF Transcript_20975/g.54591 Transcript_20975/m.54591 type:complete len:227 (-) Transcript_20975:200-880(-)
MMHGQDAALVPLGTTKVPLAKTRQFVDHGIGWAETCMLNREIRECATEEQKSELMDMVKQMAAADQELEARIEVITEIEDKLKYGEDVPALPDYGKHRLPAVLKDVQSTEHQGVTRFEAALRGDAEMEGDGDDDLMMTQDEAPTTDGFSKQPLVSAFMAPNCPTHCVFNQESVDAMFKRGGTIKCPQCDHKIKKTEMKEDNAMMARIKLAQKKMQKGKKPKAMRLD